MTAQSQLRVLTLNEKEHSTTIFRLEKGWTLHFRLGPSLADQQVRIFVNHPDTDKNSHLDRHSFREVQWSSYTDHKEDVYDSYAEVAVIEAGSFNYFFTTDESDKVSKANGSGYFLVDPVLRSGVYDEKIPLDAICCQTVLAKNLGSFDKWEERLEVAKESGYNMIHFTPIQEIGESNSAYCLKDQLKINPTFLPKDGSPCGWDEISDLVSMIASKWQVLSLTDLVLNHTANESPWVLEHPGCAYNLVNSPHLKPAYLLDRILWHFSNQVARDEWKTRWVPAELSTEQQLQTMQKLLFEEILKPHKLHEFFLIDIPSVMEKFQKHIAVLDVPLKPCELIPLVIIPHEEWRRLSATVDVPLASQHFYATSTATEEASVQSEHACAQLRHFLEHLNAERRREVDSHLQAAVNNYIANVRWRFVNPNGDRLGIVLEDEEPLMWNYFTLPRTKVTLAEEEENMFTKEASFCMAHNGWVMGDDPLRNFAEPGSNVYLRRELIPWGDSVKLRYGSSREDCPFLWDHMREYTLRTARIFHGVRLDNCHSTPIHVAEWLLDAARRVRPDLYVIAELFTNNEHMDNVFINRLGLNSLIREGLQAHSPEDLGGKVHHYGGDPVGAFFQPPARPLIPSVAHAIFFDQTHDNPSPVEKRSVYDVLPNAALLAMGCFATGSNRGYDEFVPHHIHVVKETRVYQSWINETQTTKESSSKIGIKSPITAGVVNHQTGIIVAKRALNKLHQDLALTHFTQVFVDKLGQEMVAVTRHNPINHHSVVLLARCAFSTPENMYTEPFTFQTPGEIEEVLFEGNVKSSTEKVKFTKDKDFLNGLQGYSLYFQESIKITESGFVDRVEGNHVVHFKNFPPGSIIALKVKLEAPYRKPVLAVRQVMSQFGYRMRTLSARNLSQLSTGKLEAILLNLNFEDLHRVLFRANGEEESDGQGFGAYDVPGHGPLPYCGLQGVMSILSKIRARNELGHPLCNNLRSGNWMCDYMANRLIAHPSTRVLGEWLAQAFSHLVQLPRHLIPCYFDAIVTGVYLLTEEVAYAKMSPFISEGSIFVRMLSLGCLQFCSYVSSSRLPPLAPSLSTPLPPMLPSGSHACPTLAAGLPHFANGLFRNWGRDTFISLRGLLLLTGREHEARWMNLAFAGTLCHGLIPNLLGEGTHARYNCRDAVWWWLMSIQAYCELKGDTSLLQEPVLRMYPKDDSPPQTEPKHIQPLHEVIQEALQCHASGICFRERNAGPGIDEHMTHEGFNVTAGVQWDTGFVYGGNKHNCGTWMDKMGSSGKAGNKGKPATPRDGSAVELVGLCKATVRWLAEMYRQKSYPHKGVKVTSEGKERLVSFEEWNALIQKNFERCFWVGQKHSDQHDAHPELINQHCIYKDSVGSALPWTDYQLRPNFPVAMVVAPELFTPLQAWSALNTAENILVGPLGMKTLDPSDWAYHGDYNNADDSSKAKVAGGWNYHQGPEWLWPLGYFLRAKLYFARLLEKSDPGIVGTTERSIRSILSRHNVHVHNSEWCSLPELTNKEGAFCKDSCAAQAWSVACILEVLYDLNQQKVKS